MGESRPASGVTEGVTEEALTGWTPEGQLTEHIACDASCCLGTCPTVRILVRAHSLGKRAEDSVFVPCS